MRGVMHLILLLAVCSFTASAEQIYIAQTQAGGNTGADCANAHAASWFNTSTNWSNPKQTGKIGPGDTVHLCGTFTGAANSTILAAQASGSSGSLITIKWESGALLSSPSCPANGCFNTNDKSYLVLDGNHTTPSITATNTGSAGSFTYQTDGIGIDADNCDNCELTNLSITNIYRFTNPSDSNANGGGIRFYGASHIKIHDSSFDQMGGGLGDGFQNGDTDIEIYNCTFTNYNHGIEIGNNNQNKISNVRIHNNNFGKMSTWDSTGNWYHHDGIIMYQDSLLSSSVSDVNIYDNLFEGDMGVNASAWIWINSGLDGVWIFNNKFHNTSSTQTSSRMVGIGDTGDKNVYVLHNYFECGGSGMGVQASTGGAISNLTVENNAFHGTCIYGYYANLTLGTGVIDHNVYAGITSSNDGAFKWNNAYTSLSGMQSAGNDTHSINPSSLGIDSTGQPQTGSALIHDGTKNFANLSSFCSGNRIPLCSDYLGNARPSSGSNNWDAGPYLYGGTTATAPEPAPPVGLIASAQ